MERVPSGICLPKIVLSHAPLVLHFPTPGHKWGCDKVKVGEERHSERILGRKLERIKTAKLSEHLLDACIAVQYLVTINSFHAHGSPTRRCYSYPHLQRSEQVSSEAGLAPHGHRWGWHLN